MHITTITNILHMVGAARKATNRTEIITISQLWPFLLRLLTKWSESGSRNLILPREPLAIGYFVAPSKEKKMYKIKLKVKVKLMNKTMQKFNENQR